MKSLSPYSLFILFLSCSEENVQEAIPAQNPYFEQAFAYLDAGKADSAFFYFDRSEDLFLENKDSLNVAMCLINMAIILTNKSDYYGGQETSLQAIPYLDPSNPKHHSYIGSNYNNLGIATYQLKDYPKALDFYDSAIKFSDDSLDIRIFLNNKAKIYHDNEQYAEALKIYNQLINENSKNKREYARTLTNISLSRLGQNPAYDAAPDLLSALRIRQEEQDLWGQNSSYAHLTDYYSQKKPDSGLFYAQKMYVVAKKISSATDQIHALQRLVKLSPHDSGKRYFETYRQLRDSVELARNAAKNQFALIRYEVEKNKADNLKLQKDNAEKTYQVNRQRIVTSIVVFLTIVFLVLGIYWYKKRKQRLELEAENHIKSHQLKTSKKIHDVVANGIYRVMAEIENQQQLDRERILDKLENMYEKSRDISYETDDLTAKQPDFNQQVTEMLTSFATTTTKVLIAGNEPEVWQHVAAQARHEVEHILQELMVNMRKHSQATQVVLRFEQQDNQVHIYYSDNGVGLPQSFRQRNGLTNTGNRIKSIHGQLTFDGNAEKGLKIQISFPVS